MSWLRQTYPIIDGLYKLLTIVAIAAAVGMVALATAADYFNFSVPLVSDNFLAKFTVFDFPDRESESMEVNRSVFYYLAFFILALVAIRLSVAVLRKNRRIRTASEYLSKFSRTYTDELTKALGIIHFEIRGADAGGSDGSTSKRTGYDNIVLKQGYFFKLVCNELVDISSQYAGSKCSVNIKSFNSKNGMIVTHARSGPSIDERNQVYSDSSENPRSFKMNSAFVAIVENATCEYFVSENLRKDEKNGDYSNHANNKWNDFYNSCIVVPITRQTAPFSAEDIWGFICVDTLHGKFRDDYLVDILRIASVLLTTYFECVVSVLQNEVTEHESTERMKTNEQT